MGSAQKPFLPQKPSTSWWPTALDYSILIALAVASALFVLHHLTKKKEIIADRPNPKLEEVTKQ
jgi:hypothetical protein